MIEFTDRLALLAEAHSNLPLGITPMNAEIKAQWVDRLYSGKVAQAKTALKRLKKNIKNETIGVEYCVLGVLAEMYVTEHPDEAFKQHTDPYIPADELFLEPELGAYLPQRVLDWAGLTDMTQKALSNMNDSGISLGDLGFVVERCL